MFRGAVSVAVVEAAVPGVEKNGTQPVPGDEPKTGIRPWAWDAITLPNARAPYKLEN